MCCVPLRSFSSSFLICNAYVALPEFSWRFRPLASRARLRKRVDVSYISRFAFVDIKALSLVVLTLQAEKDAQRLLLYNREPGRWGVRGGLWYQSRLWLLLQWWVSYIKVRQLLQIFANYFTHLFAFPTAFPAIWQQSKAMRKAQKGGAAAWLQTADRCCDVNGWVTLHSKNMHINQYYSHFLPACCVSCCFNIIEGNEGGLGGWSCCLVDSSSGAISRIWEFEREINAMNHQWWPQAWWLLRR